MPHRQDLPFWQAFYAPNPAPGQDLIHAQSGGVNSRTFAGYIELVTDANVANRVMTYELSDGTRTLFASSASFVQPASTTYKYSLVSSGSDYGVVTGVLHIPLPALGLVGLPGWIGRTRVVNMQPGDQIQNAAVLVYQHPIGPDVTWDPSLPLLSYQEGV